MKIRNASLCLRFYRADGWTRDKVVALGLHPKDVSLRAFEAWLDSAIRAKESDLFFDTPVADYYATYTPEGEAAMPSIAQLEAMGHEVVAFNPFLETRKEESQEEFVAKETRVLQNFSMASTPGASAVVSVEYCCACGFKTSKPHEIYAHTEEACDAGIKPLVQVEAEPEPYYTFKERGENEAQFEGVHVFLFRSELDGRIVVDIRTDPDASGVDMHPSGAPNIVITINDHDTAIDERGEFTERVIPANFAPKDEEE